jgi:hypothetical protein
MLTKAVAAVLQKIVFVIRQCCGCAKCQVLMLLLLSTKAEAVAVMHRINVMHCRDNVCVFSVPVTA